MLKEPKGRIKYRITIIVFDSILVSYKIIKNTKKFWLKQIGKSSLPFEFDVL
jgi:hypothetical protein